ncbi:MAG TPA: C25 family cysteine peptidase [Geobacter anodireducens]|nr:C25 family cysteine peptidase [Geobacter anodireducens]
MADQQWISVRKGAKEDAPSAKKVQKSGIAAVRDRTVARARRGSTKVVYELGGAWKGTFAAGSKQYDTLYVPGAGSAAQEGYPEIPQEGIFVAVPLGAKNITVTVVKKTMQEVPGTWNLRPAPKPVTEEEHLAGKDEFKPKAEVYGSDKEFPGKDVEFLGLRSVEGVPVAHVLVYLAQYKPKSGRISLVKSMTIEVGYDIPATRDAVPRSRAVTPLLSDMILDIENVGGEFRGLNASVFREEPPEPGGIVGGLTPEPAMGSRGPTDAGPVLKQTGIVCEYLIITTQALSTAVQPLLAAKTGWPHYARVATTQTITAEFPAADIKESIRACLSWAWDNWSCPPRFVVLAGDVDAIPTHSWTIGGGTYASDHYYADIRGNLSPEIVVSRLPTSDAVKMQQICQNLAAYAVRRGPDWGGWPNQVALVAYEDGVYKTCSDEIATMIAPRFTVAKLYGDSSTRQQVVNKMNAGVLVANYRGHGSKTAWSSANGLRVAEIKALNNGAMPPLVFCICCQNAWIDDQATETVVEAFLRDGKCVAVLGASRNSPTYANNDFDKYLWRAIIDHGEVTPGGIFQRAKALMVQNHGTSTSHQQDVVMYMLFGDPTARVASTAEFLRGTWDMDHDGWKGTLVINRIWQSRVVKVGSCGYPVWSISGTYTGQDGKAYAMTGTIGGQDANNGNPGCKRSDHRVSFTIAFPGNSQQFTGYVTTWTRNVMGGYTWWSKIPFGWYAKKR